MPADESTPSPVPPVPLTGGVWTPGRRLLTVGLIMLVTLVASEALAVATVMPQVERDLGDLGLYGWVFSAFFLGSLVGIVVSGRACDRMRPFVPFAVGLVLFVAGLLMAGSATSMPMLVAARLLQGLGAGALPAVAYVCIGRQYPPAARPRMFALLSTAWVVPSLIGPTAAAVVGSHFGWQWVFLGLVPVVVACGAVVLGSVARVPGPDAPGAGGSNLRDALLVAAGAGVLLVGLDQHQVLLLVPLSLAGVAIGLPAFRRLTPPGTLTARRGLAAAIAVRGLLTFSFFQADAYVPLTLTTVRGAATLVGGAALTASSLLWTVGAWVQERRIGKDGPRPLVGGGLVFLALGIGLLMITLANGVPVWLGIVAWGVGGLGIGVAYSPLSVTALAEAEPGQEGSVTAALQLSEQLGVALGTGTGGVIIAAGHRAGWPPRPALVIVFAVALVVSLVGAALAHRLPSRVLHETPTTAGAVFDEVATGAAPQGLVSGDLTSDGGLTEPSQVVRDSLIGAWDRGPHDDPSSPSGRPPDRPV
ncbi:MAG TPA: MFS transporter [Acidimicrobiales bacterium]|nr:MFS transporter [Acidimicrobiales bacterium]